MPAAVKMLISVGTGIMVFTLGIEAFTLGIEAFTLGIETVEKDDYHESIGTRKAFITVGTKLPTLTNVKCTFVNV